jgi:hypothetical protein
MSEVNKDLLRVLRVDIDTALKVVTQKHGITFNAGKCTYDPRHGNLTFQVEGVAAGGIDRDGARYELLRQSHPQLPPLKSTFNYRSKTHQIVGANSTGTKVLTRSGGDGYQFHVEVVERLCRKERDQ